MSAGGENGPSGINNGEPQRRIRHRAVVVGVLRKNGDIQPFIALGMTARAWEVQTEL